MKIQRIDGPTGAQNDEKMSNRLLCFLKKNSIREVSVLQRDPTGSSSYNRQNPIREVSELQSDPNGSFSYNCENYIREVFEFQRDPNGSSSCTTLKTP